MKKLLLLLAALMLLAGYAAAEETVTASSDTDHIAKHGNVQLDITNAAFQAYGYAYGDVVSVSFLDQVIDLPFCPNYYDVDSGAAGLFVHSSDDYLLLAVNTGDFATTYGIATKTTNEDKSFYWSYCEGVEGPVVFTISMAEKRGYYDQFVLHDLTRTNERADYADLTDAEYANFRAVTTTGMGEGVLYRTSSPVNPKIGRSEQANAACLDAGVTVIMNLADSEEDLDAYGYGKDNIYAVAEHIALNMSVDFASADFRDKLAEGLRFMAAHDGVYAVHCNEGKDRAGFVSALLECLMGASFDEVTADYMVTYANYYGVMPGDERYDVILNSNIVLTLARAFQVQDLASADLAACAEQYLQNIGLTADEIARLRANLAE